MAVELAVLMPVVLVVALIGLNALHFAELVARFDRIAPDAVLVQGVSPSGASWGLSGVSDIKNHIVEAMQDSSCEITVGVQELDAASSSALINLASGAVQYTCKLTFHPWPLSISIAGAAYSIPFEVTHVRSLVVDRYRSAIIT